MNLQEQKNKFFLLLIFIASFLFLGWGYVGHRIINYNTIRSALPEMEFFESWADSLKAHASDADFRKSWDPDEGPKHYIDIDNYPEFITTGTIPQDFDSLVAIHGYSFVLQQGILPWAILAAADSLHTLFELNDMHQAILIAADIGHYIGDSHMPLHITRNYNGQYTNQYGVHSRYESDMIASFQSQIIYGGDSLVYVENLSDFIFNMLYENYEYVDSVLYADSVAYTFAGNNYNTTYYNKLWELTKDFTIGLFQKASYRLTCIIYTQWINAGGTTFISDQEDNFPFGFELSQNYPNPFNPSTNIGFRIADRGFVTLKLYDILGNEIATLVNEEKQPGVYEVEFNSSSIKNLPSSGTYFYQLQVSAMQSKDGMSGNFIETRKMILLK